MPASTLLREIPMTRTYKPAFNLPYQESPIQGITDRSWTKLQEYDPLFIEVIQTVGENPEITKRTPQLSLEDCKAVRLDWYNAQRYVKRRADLNAAYPYTTDIKCYLIEVTNAHGYLEFRVGQTRQASIASRRVMAQGGLLTGTIEDPRPSPDFATKEEERQHFSGETYQLREERAARDRILQQTIQEREEAFRWEHEHRSLNQYVPYEGALETLRKTYPKIHAIVVSITPEEWEDYLEHVKHETRQFGEFQDSLENKYKDERNPNAFQDKLARGDEET